MSGTSHSAGPSGTTKRTLGEGTKSEIGAVKRQKMSEKHPAAGLKLTIHGNVYQLKLLTLFLKRGLDLGYSFTLTTEMVEAEKFDDIVFGYTDKNGKDVCRFLQAKHKQDGTKEITQSDLLAEKDDEFSIKKYFISYCKIKRNPEFEGYHLQDFTICTNINLDENLANYFEEITGTDNILQFERYVEFKRFKIILDRFPKKDELESILHRTSVQFRLANMLAVHVFKDKCLELRDLFKAYHGVLGEKVIDVEVGKFRSEFIEGESDPSSVFERFRKNFYDEYRHVSKTQIHKNEFWVMMKDVNLKISSTFGKNFELDPNPQLTDDKEALAEEIVKAIKGADENIVQIIRERGKKVGIIKDNIDKLAGYVFVKKEDQNKEFYFNSKFLDENEKLPCHLDAFRTKFVEKLKDEGIEFSKMNEYKFHIAKFKTCEEGQIGMKLSLPDDCIDDTDIQGFFESFVLAVNQPNEEKLGDIIQEEIGKDFNLIDSELMASKLQKDMLNWMKDYSDKKGRFLTNEQGNAFFEEIRQKVSKLVLIGPTLVYRAKIQQFQMSFRDDLIALRNFLNSEHEQIFNLISSCGDTVLGSIKVLETLKKLNTYKTDDSYIFMRLNPLLRIRKRVMEAFSSGMSCNLLAIECKVNKSEENWYKLCKQLSALLKRDKNKKVILITLENDILAEKFKNDFSASNHYKEIIDEKINLSDLTDKSREKILMEGEVIFLGKKVSLGAVVDAESAHLLSGELLSMLINNKKIEISKVPMDSSHTEVEDYFIDRTFFRKVVIKTDFRICRNFFIVDDLNRDMASIIQSDGDIVSISDTSEMFEELCQNQEITQRNIHWLKKEDDHFIWQQTRGDLEELRKFVDNRESSVKTYKPSQITDFIWQQTRGDLEELRELVDNRESSVKTYKPSQITDIPDRVVLLTAEPGMGKSVILSHLALKTQSASSPMWIIRCNLNDYTQNFYDWLKDRTDINKPEATKFLCEIANFQHFKYSVLDEVTKNKIQCALFEENIEIIYPTENMKGLSLFEIKLFIHFFRHGKVLLLFDGFDEICPIYNNLIMKLLIIFKNTKVEKMWLTSRPYNIKNELENRFSTFSYELKPFLEEEKSDFLNKLWRKNLNCENFDEMRANDFTCELLNQLSKAIKDQKIKFLMTPLQIHMIATIFFKKFEKYYFSARGERPLENEPELAKMDLATLYEEFLNKHYIMEDRKLHNFDEYKSKPTAEDKIKKGLADFIKDHEILAVYSIFRADQFKKNLPEQTSNIKKLIGHVKKGQMKTGIIIRIVDREPQFIHRTFAEYLVASYIWKKFVSIPLRKFKNDFIPNIVIDILIKDAKIQVSEFLQLIAKKKVFSKSGFSKWKFKMEFLLKELAYQNERSSFVEDFGNVLKPFGPCEYPFTEASDGGFARWQQVPQLNERFAAWQMVAQWNKHFVEGQVVPTKFHFVEAKKDFEIIRLLLGIIEFSLTKRKDKYDFTINRDQSLELLCKCAKMGYKKVAQELMGNLNTEHFKRHLSSVNWWNSPLWIAAKNHHLDIVKVLVENFSYCAAWKDKDGEILINRALGSTKYKVLISCLKLGILDCGPFSNGEELPIYTALGRRAPPEVIKLLIEKTDANLVNKFIHQKSKLPISDLMILMLRAYDNPIEIISFAIKKGFHFSFSMNILFSELYATCFKIPVNELIYYRDIFFFVDRSLNENKFSNLFSIIELLLKFGVGYSYSDKRHSRLQLSMPLEISTYDLVCQMYYVHKFISEVYKLHKRKIRENCDPRQIILKLFIDYIRSIGFTGVFIVFNPHDIVISPRYENELAMTNSKRIREIIHKVISNFSFTNGIKLVLNSNDISTVLFPDELIEELNATANPILNFDFMKDLKLMLYSYNDISTVSFPNELIEDLAKAYPFPDQVMMELFFEHYKNDDSNLDLVLKIGDIFAKYRELIFANKMSENFEIRDLRYKSPNKLVNKLLHGVSLLHFRQGYEIDDAMKEILEKASKFENGIKKLLEIKKNSGCELDLMELDYDNILEILDLKHIDCENVNLRYLIPELDSCPEVLSCLIEVYMNLSYVGQKKLMEVFEQMLKYCDQSKPIFELYEQLHESYKSLIRAIELNNIYTVSNVLENVKQDFVKAVINGLDKERGSPLHYAAFNGQTEITSILLQNGANPNLRLCNNAEKIKYFPQAVGKMKKNPFLPNNFINWTPLYFAVLNDHQEVVRELINYGADVNPVLDHHSQDGYTPLHVSALTGHLEIARLLLEKGALYNVQNEEGKTPLDLATGGGSDIYNLLGRIDRIFQTVLNGEKEVINSLFEEVNVDWEVVLNARNADSKTLLNLARDNKQADIVELLMEKSRSI